MTAHLNCDNRFAGTIKFERGFPLEKLVEIVRELRQHRPSQWVDLHIRGAGDENRYIAFHIILKEGEKEKKAGHRLIGFLKDQLGTRAGTKGKVPTGVTGWSMSTVQLVV